jgi:hypothetical protein
MLSADILSGTANPRNLHVDDSMFSNFSRTPRTCGSTFTNYAGIPLNCISTLSNCMRMLRNCRRMLANYIAKIPNKIAQIPAIGGQSRPFVGGFAALPQKSFATSVTALPPDVRRWLRPARKHFI